MTCTFDKAVRLACCAVLIVVAGCTTRADSNPARTATEQILISTAADRASDKLTVSVPYGSKVFVDTTSFEGTDSKYAAASIRDALLRRGVHIMDDKKNADVIIEARAGALSTDRISTLVGIPAFNIPVPLTSGDLPFPEIALYKNDRQTGVAKFAVTGYDAHNGELLSSVDPQYGFAHNTHKTVLIFISWAETDALPDEDKSSDNAESSNGSGGTVNGNITRDVTFTKDQTRSFVAPSMSEHTPAAVSTPTTSTSLPSALRF